MNTLVKQFIFGVFAFNLGLLLAVSAAKAEDFKPLTIDYSKGEVVAEAELVMYNYSAEEIYVAALNWMSYEFTYPNRMTVEKIEKNSSVTFTGQSRDIFYTRLYTTKIYYDFSFNMTLKFEDEKLSIVVTRMAMTGDHIYGSELEQLYDEEGSLRNLESYVRWNEEANTELNRLVNSFLNIAKEQKHSQNTTSSTYNLGMDVNRN